MYYTWWCKSDQTLDVENIASSVAFACSFVTKCVEAPPVRLKRSIQRVTVCQHTQNTSSQKAVMSEFRENPAVDL